MKKFAVILYTIAVVALFVATKGANVPILPPV